MSISPWSHHTANAIRFKKAVDSGGLWCVLGGTVAWTDEDAPPIPAFNTVVVSTPIGAKKGAAIWVRESAVGTYSFTGLDGALLYYIGVETEAEVVTNAVRHVRMSADIRGDDLPLDSFREIGWFTDLTHNQAAATTVLTPAQITSYGNLEAIEYRRETTRESTSTNFISALIEF